MELKSHEDIAIPIDAAWKEITNFKQFEAGLRKRRVELERDDGDVGEGTSWSARFPFAGRTLKATAAVAKMDAPKVLRLEGQGTGIDGYAEIVLTALDDGNTRADVSTGLKAKAIGAQVILQPLRLAEGKLQNQLDAQVERIARGMEFRYAQAPGAGDLNEA